MHDRILHEIAIICRIHGFEGDMDYFLDRSPLGIASSLQRLGVDNLVIGIVSSWGESLSEREVLLLLKSINDRGTI